MPLAELPPTPLPAGMEKGEWDGTGRRSLLELLWQPNGLCQRPDAAWGHSDRARGCRGVVVVGGGAGEGCRLQCPPRARWVARASCTQRPVLRAELCA